MIREDLKFGDTNRLVRYANKMRGFYGHPVYLVGSALIKDSPRDYDLICIIPDIEFITRYAYDTLALHREDEIIKEVEKWELGCNDGLSGDTFWRWSDDCLKKSLSGTRYTRKYIDFKVLPASNDLKYYEKHSKLRLDTRPDLI